MAVEENPKTHQDPETELQDAFKKLRIVTDKASPRGVLEIPISDGSSVSETSSPSSRSTSSSTTSIEKAPPQKGGGGVASTVVSQLNYGIPWKGFFDTVKRKSGVRRFSTSTIALFTSYDLSAKSLRRKLARIRSADDGIDCGLLPVAKPSWRNFCYAELEAEPSNLGPKLLRKSFHRSKSRQKQTLSFRSPFENQPEFEPLSRPHPDSEAVNRRRRLDSAVSTWWKRWL